MRSGLYPLLHRPRRRSSMYVSRLRQGCSGQVLLCGPWRGEALQVRHLRQVGCGRLQPVHRPWRRSPLHGGRLRQVGSIVDEVLCQARGREEMLARYLRKGCTWPYPVLRSSKSLLGFDRRWRGSFSRYQSPCSHQSSSFGVYCVIQHGGGVRCKLAGCNRVAIGKLQLCRAHGGGARPRNDGGSSSSSNIMLPMPSGPAVPEQLPIFPPPTAMNGFVQADMTTV